MAASDDRLSALEQRIEYLEKLSAESVVTTAPTGTFWALEGLRDRSTLWPGGGVLYTGSVDLVPGEHVDWQMAHPVEDVVAGDWAEFADALAALGHPVRLRLVQAVATGTRTMAALQAALPDLGTAGQVYHHLRALTAAGWLRAAGRGHWEVPPERQVPLLVVVSAARH